MKDVFIAVPGFGQIISATTFLTTHALRAAMSAKGIGGGISTLSFPDIAELRSMFMTIWYDTMPKSTHMLFIDSDMGFPPDLVIDMLLFDEPLIGAIYPQRKLPLSWAGSGTGTPTTERRGDFMQVEGVGFGCTLIRRDLVTTMLEKMPHIVDNRLALHPAGETLRQAGTNRLIRAFEKVDLPDRGIVSEDLSFCIRWRECGGECWAAIGHRMSHVGPFDYAGRYLDAIEQASEPIAGMEAPAPMDEAAIAALMQTNSATVAPVEMLPVVEMDQAAE